MFQPSPDELYPDQTRASMNSRPDMFNNAAMMNVPQAPIIEPQGTPDFVRQQGMPTSSRMAGPSAQLRSTQGQSPVFNVRVRANGQNFSEMANQIRQRLPNATVNVTINDRRSSITPQQLSQQLIG
jgi:hypothetical protein